MARKARQESATGYYHVMIRGINREFLFSKEASKALYMELVKDQVAKSNIELSAWCVMDNHAHMIIKAEKHEMSRAIKIISLKFAAHYNREQQRVGPVFGDRFRSEPVEDDNYLLGALRYVHMNPVRAGLVTEPAAYRWSSFVEYFGSAKYIAPGQKAFMLEWFAGDSRKFSEFHNDDDETEYLEIRETVQECKQMLASGVIEAFCRENGTVEAREITRNRKLFARLCCVLVNDLGLSLRETAEYLATAHQRVHEALQE